MNYEAYEMTDNTITGYRVYNSGRLIGTLERRGHLWIAGIVRGLNVITWSSPDKCKACEWITLNVELESRV